MDLWETTKSIFWRIPFLSDTTKDSIYHQLRTLKYGRGQTRAKDANVFAKYTKGVLENQNLDNLFSINYPKEARIVLTDKDPKLLAFYLPQYYPDSHNNIWWGKGSTEWTNTTKATAQYLGQYQPRLPGELGFYDLRIKENIYRQIELAKIHGIYGFCFYYYWFDGERILDLPLDEFVEDKQIDFPFSICWVNESWTKQWSSSSQEILIEQHHTVESYKAFIHSCLLLFTRKNYIRVKGRPLLNVFRLTMMDDWPTVISYWRKVVKDKLGVNLYIVGCLSKESQCDVDYLSVGFDAVSEFSSFGLNVSVTKDITQEKAYVCDRFLGKVYDYKDYVEAKKYFTHTSKKLYRSVSVGYDNTARKRNKGFIYDGAIPELYGKWLTDVIVETEKNLETDDKLIYLFAWNEWAEGAYLEPDLKFQYGYLEETAKAIEKARIIIKDSAGGQNH